MAKASIEYFVSAICALGVCSCVPIPNWTIVTPQVEATVLRNGKPVVDMSVWFGSRGGCGPVIREARTNENGHVTIGPVREFSPIIQLESYYSWFVCADVDGVPVTLSAEVSLGNAPGLVRLSCHLERVNEQEALRVGSTIDKDPGVCERDVET